MAINGINFGNLIQQTGSSPLAAGRTQSSTDDFGSLVKSAVESIDQTQKGAEQEISKAVTGESPDLHKTIIQMQTADLKFQLGLQVRNKLIGAYEEIMRMQV
ncbi:MAG: flagellar hook-basal body complex protein FliE [Acidobacteria bacterium]|nr:flagellar hook-basal body complex protein FliE [Acidobacteriota bacterium]